MQATQLEILGILQKNFSKEDSEKILTFLSTKNADNVAELKLVFLTKDDKIDLITRMDSHFKWLAGIILTLFGLAIAIMKL